MKLLGRSHLIAFAAVAIMAVGVGAALADTQHHQPPAHGGKHGSHGPCSPAQVAAQQGHGGRLLHDRVQRQEARGGGGQVRRAGLHPAQPAGGRRLRRPSSTS